ncbi:hypothetical protein A2634_01440 [Candidatus Amesbacteria bacterium RIFCSPHIGHO2_01_FULL_48_32]|uniref:OBG-type G domain-containing protein n=1 Tax=Candidatus Amesbacteria bacterium RIFCSPLOWO2_01_FULL_48_25 TaxID=1797259 RepID=A0A1F4ZCQ2_9BACT|nr:MAG: hypothetical protein A2634_01440 [Candidatus Amesbacteria bacterium RIFCSPHIGHO2_01_FULL_48_32]OGD03706.1 MAG: hypothetical protein A2989_03425 [Candidatus Amesbacteria bacterium RIFCSPLOWO2_01_FULL_48_25]HJZ05946.1 redox-regulated ATPase YchF [Patescibacteria group bacterium]
MGLEIGIIGLPNVGKSTLFNALLRKQQAYVANYPFATIEPNIGIVPVPDERLQKLADVAHTEKIVPATVKFVDIAGLVKGASQGEGLGNKFLSHIREVDAIVYVLRDFTDENVIRAGSVSPQSDYETLRTELQLADLETIEKRKAKKGEIQEALALLAEKPEIKVLNVDEDKIAPREEYIVLSAKLESELGDEIKDLGISESGLEKLIKRSYEILGLQSFLTAGEKEVRAWTIKRGIKAPQAAGVIHTDFEKHFIKADVIYWEDFVKLGGWQKAREAGKVRLEGRDYVMQEGDVVEFKVGV